MSHSTPSSSAPNHNAAATAQRRYFNHTPLGNAERLVYEHGANIRYCPAWNSWLVWDGRRWSIDYNAAIHRKAHNTVRAIGREAQDTSDLKLAAAIESHARRSETKYNLDAMIGSAQTLNGVSITPEELDKDPYLLNCQNGVINLRTGQITQHAKSKHLMLMKMASVSYVPGAQCPLFLQFLDEIFKGDAAMIEYVQKIIGYSLTGNVMEKALFLFLGDGNNGKTTLLETIRHMLGDYAGVVDINALMQGSQDSARERAIADLHGKRFVTASESEASHRFAEATIKRLTGGIGSSGGSCGRMPLNLIQPTNCSSMLTTSPPSGVATMRYGTGFGSLHSG